VAGTTESGASSGAPGPAVQMNPLKFDFGRLTLLTQYFIRTHENKRCPRAKRADGGPPYLVSLRIIIPGHETLVIRASGAVFVLGRLRPPALGHSSGVGHPNRVPIRVSVRECAFSVMISHAPFVGDGQAPVRVIVGGARRLIQSSLSIRKTMRKLVTIGLLALTAGAAMAGTDATVITTAAESAFTDIATLCVAIGTFFVVYRLVKRVK